MHIYEWEMAWSLRHPHVCYAWPDKCLELYVHVSKVYFKFYVNYILDDTTISFDCDSKHDSFITLLQNIRVEICLSYFNKYEDYDTYIFVIDILNSFN